ncbi:testis-expressed protein 44 [Pteropus vampyrus]|uniref:Testis-expressed protein 44 n=1 Tax=Pteropus vampyrus TaxID=132908 RepID=A0A6P3RL17_PTEVA|nr:testis-expressed protein 44 [Pteropus vampyrus]
MTTVPSEEATATSISTHGDSRSSESPTLGSQSQASLRADVPVASGTSASAEWQDVDQASIKPDPSEAVSLSGDKDKHEDAAEFSQEPKLVHLAPGSLQMSVSLQNQVQDRPVQNARMTQSLQIFQHGSLVNEETPQTAGVLDGEQELALSTPSAVAQSSQNVPAVSTADADIQLDTLATGTTEAVVEKPEHPEALHPDTEALPSAKFQVVPELDVTDYSGDLQAPPSPRGSVPPLPGPSMVAPGRPLDSSLYMASGEDNYLHSMTSLLAGGEGSIRSLADVLVWSEDTLGMATGLLASSRSSVTDLLRSTGPRLRSASSILRNASLAISSGLAARTNSAMLCIVRMLERAEQRTIEGIRSAVRYLTSHLTPR